MAESNPTVVELAGTSFGLLYDGCPGHVEPDPAYKGFLSNNVPDISITCKYNGLPGPLPEKEDCIFDSRSVWTVYRRGDTEIFLLKLTGAEFPHRMAIFDSDFTRGEIHTDTTVWASAAEGRLPFPLCHPLGPLTLVSVLARAGGLMVHSCGIDDNGAGYAFVGSSTYGKSTMAKIWNRSACVLNDDRIVIRRSEDCFKIYGTPWPGEFPSVSPGGVKLERIFFLQKSGRNALRPLGPAQASIQLLQRSQAPLWDVNISARVLDFVADLVNRVPSYILEFLPDESIVDFIRCTR
jgi:hypothetical protein